jgi:hypothetical protein
MSSALSTAAMEAGALEAAAVLPAGGALSPFLLEPDAGWSVADMRAFLECGRVPHARCLDRAELVAAVRGATRYGTLVGPAGVRVAVLTPEGLAPAAVEAALLAALAVVSGGTGQGFTEATAAEMRAP